LKNKIEVEEKEGRDYAEKNNMAFLLTSAKTGMNVEDAFKDLIDNILKKIA